jgi:hypothetical protein
MPEAHRIEGAEEKVIVFLQAAIWTSGRFHVNFIGSVLAVGGHISEP